jgi:VIT1/CCC1 family predicted Fe2+/Mn2+ transporter
MREAFRTGASFGLTSGVLTTLGLIVGLYAGTRSQLAVVGGIFTIAVADGLSDALGMHVHEESENEHTPQQIWAATGATFITKLVTSLSFLVPLFTLELPLAVAASVVWAFALLAWLSYRLAVSQGTSPWRAIAEHLTIAVAVVAVTHLLGVWVAQAFT